jgi:DNA-binding response OmpR family regulator
VAATIPRYPVGERLAHAGVIFLTDDEPAIRSVITKPLIRQSRHAVGYESGEALLEGLQDNLPNLVLLDVKLPGMSWSQGVKTCVPAAVSMMTMATGAHLERCRMP